MRDPLVAVVLEPLRCIGAYASIEIDGRRSLPAESAPSGAGTELWYGGASGEMAAPEMTRPDPSAD